MIKSINPSLPVQDQTFDGPQVLRELEAFIAAGRGTQGSVAKAIGVTSGVLGQVRRGIYGANPTPIIAKVASFLSLQGKRAEVTEAKQVVDIAFTPTSNAKRIMELLELCHVEREMGVITGHAGWGKTVTLKEYARKNTGSVVLVEADFSMTARVLFNRLSEALDLPTKGNLQTLLDNVILKLRSTERLIIIDEAEHLNYRSLELVRRVHDKAGVGVALAGMPRLYHNLRGDKGDYAQLYSRVGAVVQLREGLSESDAQRLCENAGVRGDTSHLIKAAGGNGRRLSKLLRRASRVARINQMDMLHPEVVATATSMMMF